MRGRKTETDRPTERVREINRDKDRQTEIDTEINRRKDKKRGERRNKSINGGDEERSREEKMYGPIFSPMLVAYFNVFSHNALPSQRSVLFP